MIVVRSIVFIISDNWSGNDKVGAKELKYFK
jgi:hypothetical protein